MLELRNRFAGERALVVLGGPSILERGWDLGRLAGRDLVVFLEARALTPRYLAYGLDPDFLLMFYPEKCKANALQGVIVQALAAGVDLRVLLRDEWLPEVERLERRFHEYLEPWKPDVPHKRFRWKPDVYLEGSPFDLMPRLPRMACLTYLAPYAQYVREQVLARPVYGYDMDATREPFSIQAYYEPRIGDGRVVFRDFSFSNSSAIALFPLLRFLGFRRAYFLGMDMSMLGSMEYASLYTFRSLDHFRRFFERARPVLSANYPRRFWAQLFRQVRADGPAGLLGAPAWRTLFDRNPWFVRPYDEFDSLRRVLSAPGIGFVNVHEPCAIARPVPGVRNLTFAEFLRDL